MLAVAQMEPAGGWVERRDPRHKVLIRVKMRAGGFPIDVCIRDVSRKGVCVVTATPPPRGTVVELTGAAFPIVGRVVWSTELRFGLEVGGRIDVSAILAQQAPAPRVDELVPGPAYARPVRTIAERSEASRQASSTMQYAFFCLMAAAGAMTVAHTAYASLATTSSQIIAGLEAAK